MQNDIETRSTKQILVDVSQNVAVLVREELALARAEIGEKVAALKTGAISLSAGGVLAFAGLLVLLQAGILALNLLVDAMWLSALIVGVAVMALAGLLVAMGRRRIESQDLSPRRTLESIRMDKEVFEKHVG